MHACMHACITSAVSCLYKKGTIPRFGSLSSSPLHFQSFLPMELPVKSPLETKYKLKTKNLSYKLSPRYSEFNRLAWSECNSKSVLKNVNCEAKPGELTAIAGPSGAGKTTLLDILAGMIVPFRVSGHVLVNDLPMNVAHFRRVSGYVTQDEALFPLLTVEETLTYSARLRLKAGCEKASSIVQKLLKELGLEHIAGERVGSELSRGISGGEKRRLSIGVDLVHDPAVLLLDEPTSGLDSASALHVMLSTNLFCYPMARFFTTVRCIS